MRFGLSDVRNYDSVELAAQPGLVRAALRAGVDGRADAAVATSPGQSVRRPARSPARVVRRRDRRRRRLLPAGAFARVETAGRVWIAWLDAAAWAEARLAGNRVSWTRRAGAARIQVRRRAPDRLIVRETWDPGLDGLGSTATPRRRRAGTRAVPSRSRSPQAIIKSLLAMTRPRCGSGWRSRPARWRPVILALTGFPPVLNSWNNAERGLDGPEPPS